MSNRYSTLVPIAQREAPKFCTTLDALGLAFSRQQKKSAWLVPAFDLDRAVGKQLDVLGEWIGQARAINAPIDDYFFSFDNEKLGFDLGYWKNRYDADFGYVSLDDESYRTLLRAKVGANNWDGTMETLPDILQSIWPDKDIKISVIDNQNMSITIFMVGKSISFITKEIIRQGYLAIKPGGITVIYEIAEG
ncbi:DUF2612 domain-containing protein [Enterobacteriaceae bacterium 4M9]|nr:DUF2612 domain-containing protein [Enterobacteriaceae bacterium 4M9]